MIVYTVIQALRAWAATSDRDKMEIAMDLLIFFAKATVSLDSFNRSSRPPGFEPS